MIATKYLSFFLKKTSLCLEHWVHVLLGDLTFWQLVLLCRKTTSQRILIRNKPIQIPFHFDWRLELIIGRVISVSLVFTFGYVKFKLKAIHHHLWIYILLSICKVKRYATFIIIELLFKSLFVWVIKTRITWFVLVLSFFAWLIWRHALYSFSVWLMICLTVFLLRAFMDRSNLW